ncbi:bZIP transcription factor 60-like [Lolium rigidum]|uniref:bZIP transcription factor 60-like n=1 Tax=Lolium rigidum TaxID=89674 RepID=UPI001F5C3B3C|nr:bZIP transcription factor 60-like [Lolium rigidum]
MAEASLFADLPFPDDLPEFPHHSVDDAFALEDFDLDDLDFDLDLDLFPTDDVHLPSPPPPLATSSSSSGSPAGGSSSSAGSPPGGSSSSAVETSPKNDESSESSSRTASPGNDGKPADTNNGDDKRRARLVRNRESAHLSRQRKKQYVDELEAKVKAMQATIADLSARISCVTAENAALKHQLAATAGAAGTPPPLPMYPGLYPLPPPWIHPAYAMRGSQVPLMPIPRLKTRQPAPPAGAEPPAKKAKKTKKVASVSLLGLLLLTMLCGCLLPAVNRMCGTADSGEGAVLGQSHHGRILAVDGPRSGVSEDIDTTKVQQNASETLPALLYIPRNGKHVKINGNLVIKSVVASEKASSRIPRSDGKSSVNQGNEGTGLAIPRHVAKLDSVEVVESAKRITNKLIALPPGDGSVYREDDELLPQWFSEAMSGPMLSSGMCTEVFQFNTSPTSADPNGIVPVYSSAMSNSSHNFTENVPSQKVKTRRILHSMAIPVQGSTSNHTDHLKAHPENESFAGNKPASSVVVSVLADPREDADGRISSKSLSRIFVVVLIDSVKYVTYSCVLPFKNHSPHL